MPSCTASPAARSSSSPSISNALPAWQLDYLAEGVELERPRFPSIADIERGLGGPAGI